jgi:hypothetical protein
MADGSDLDAAEALERAQGAVRFRQLTFRDHADLQMEARGAQTKDVANAITTATHATWQPDQGTWKLTGGEDLEGASLTVVVAFRGYAVRVITVF